MDEPGELGAGGATTRRPDRRRRNLGPPDGVERRGTVAGRRASDALKMACPFCGASESAVVRSRGGIVSDKVRRRRECASCGNRFPTSERLDLPLFEKELEARGVHLEELVADPLPATTENAYMLFHRAWGDAKDGLYVKKTYADLLTMLDSLLR